MTVSPSRPSRRSWRVAVTAGTTAAVLAGMLSAVTVSAPAGAASARVNAVNSAAGYAKAHGYKVGISVLDTKTGSIYHAGQYSSGFASESVIKVMIAARLLVQGRMHGSTSTRASRMIRMSDDNIANSFYGSVGGDGLLNWTKKYFKVPSLGSGPIRGNWWGSNRLTSDGLVRLYAKLKADKRIGPWLLKAMHGHTKYGADGFYQAFGLPSAARNVAVKQGWGADYSYSTSNASQNSTGYVNGDRYAVAILARGPGSSYGSRIGNAITAMAKRLLPGGSFPNGAPTVTSLTHWAGSTSGGYWVGVRGRDFTGVTAVFVSSTRTKARVQGSTYLLAWIPKHAAGVVGVYVRNGAGTSPLSATFTYGAPPTVTSVTATSGPTGGGNTLDVRGTNLTRTFTAFFGATEAPRVRRMSATLVRVRVPAVAAGRAGKVHLRVQTSFGLSGVGPNDIYTFTAPTAAPTAPTTAAPASRAPEPAPTTTPAGATTMPATAGTDAP